MASEKFRVEWDVEDGYVGGSRPQVLSVSLCEFDGDSLEEIVQYIEQSIQDDFDEKVSWYSHNYKEVAREIFDRLKETREEE
jgi:hypothetical protein